MLRWLRRFHGADTEPDDRLQQARAATAVAEQLVADVRQRGPGVRESVLRLLQASEPNHFGERITAMLQDGQHG